MVAIVQKNDPVLRHKAKSITVADIKSAGIKKVLRNMKAALSKEDDGVAIAAPQIGEPLRIFVVSGKVLTKSDAPKKSADMVFINPTFVKLSRKKKLMDEGCLSVRPLYGKVKRSEKATVRAYDEKGTHFEYGASGLMAQIFQHEMDHLEGVLFIDKAQDIVELTSDNNDTK